ncbi:hypothetical protein DY000_02008953 [Brassica cretica]|uniref:alpha-1,2-Mannosidase n=1 Tax=Brassica cretica TaxID=69181 RepID=A0ABQ7C8Y7_BRACR|nr:hypothetical protein DY000_02008953 [Brassica cretica]
MSKFLPYSVKDVHYDNAKFRHRSPLKVLSQSLLTLNTKRDYASCSTGKFLILILVFGIACLMLMGTKIPNDTPLNEKGKVTFVGGLRLGRLLRKPPRIPPRLSPDEGQLKDNTTNGPKWAARQQSVKEAFDYAWSGYRKFAMGYDELMPISQRGVDGVMGRSSSLGENQPKGSSAYHLSGGDHGPKPDVYLNVAKDLADRLLSAFNSSPTAVPYSDVILRESTAHPAPGGMSSTAEVASVQLEFNYLSAVSGDPKYSTEAMKVLAHIKTLPKTEGLVPIYISPHSGGKMNGNFTYLHDMYTEAMKGVRHLLVRKSIPKGLVFVGELPYGSKGEFSPKMDHLVCFLPGTLALGATKGLTKEKALAENLLSFEDLENLKLAEDLAKACFEMYEVTATGLAPEIAYFHAEEYSEDGLEGGNKSSAYAKDIIIKHADRHNLLRPETVESLFVLYPITKDTKYREQGWQIFQAFEKHTKVKSGGYTSLDDVTEVPPHRRDKMETFFLGETLKYLYLLFGDDSVIPLDKFVFNTEAHPLPIRNN